MVPGTGKKGVSISKPEEDPVAVAAQFQYWANRSRYFWTLERQKKEAQQDSPLPQAMPANSFLLSYVGPDIDVTVWGYDRTDSNVVGSIVSCDSGYCVHFKEPQELDPVNELRLVLLASLHYIGSQSPSLNLELAIQGLQHPHPRFLDAHMLCNNFIQTIRKSQVNPQERARAQDSLNCLVSQAASRGSKWANIMAACDVDFNESMGSLLSDLKNEQTKPTGESKMNGYDVHSNGQRQSNGRTGLRRRTSTVSAPVVNPHDEGGAGMMAAGASAASFRSIDALADWVNSPQIIAAAASTPAEMSAPRDALSGPSVDDAAVETAAQVAVKAAAKKRASEQEGAEQEGAEQEGAEQDLKPGDAAKSHVGDEGHDRLREWIKVVSTKVERKEQADFYITPWDSHRRDQLLLRELDRAVFLFETVFAIQPASRNSASCVVSLMLKQLQECRSHYQAVLANSAVWSDEQAAEAESAAAAARSALVENLVNARQCIAAMPESEGGTTAIRKQVLLQQIITLGSMLIHHDAESVDIGTSNHQGTIIDSLVAGFNDKPSSLTAHTLPQPQPRDLDDAAWVGRLKTGFDSAGYDTLSLDEDVVVYVNYHLDTINNDFIESDLFSQNNGIISSLDVERGPGKARMMKYMAAGMAVTSAVALPAALLGAPLVAGMAFLPGLISTVLSGGLGGVVTATLGDRIGRQGIRSRRLVVERRIEEMKAALLRGKDPSPSGITKENLRSFFNKHTRCKLKLWQLTQVHAELLREIEQRDVSTRCAELQRHQADVEKQIEQLEAHYHQIMTGTEADRIYDEVKEDMLNQRKARQMKRQLETELREVEGQQHDPQLPLEIAQLERRQGYLQSEIKAVNELSGESALNQPLYKKAWGQVKRPFNWFWQLSKREKLIIPVVSFHVAWILATFATSIGHMFFGSSWITVAPGATTSGTVYAFMTKPVVALASWLGGLSLAATAPWLCLALCAGVGAIITSRRVSQHAKKSNDVADDSPSLSDLCDKKERKVEDVEDLLAQPRDYTKSPYAGPGSVTLNMTVGIIGLTLAATMRNLRKLVWDNPVIKLLMGYGLSAVVVGGGAWLSATILGATATATAIATAGAAVMTSPLALTAALGPWGLTILAGVMLAKGMWDVARQPQKNTRRGVRGFLLENYTGGMVEPVKGARFAQIAAMLLGCRQQTVQAIGGKVDRWRRYISTRQIQRRGHQRVDTYDRAASRDSALDLMAESGSSEWVSTQLSIWRQSRERIPSAAEEQRQEWFLRQCIERFSLQQPYQLVKDNPIVVPALMALGCMTLLATPLGQVSCITLLSAGLAVKARKWLGLDRQYIMSHYHDRRRQETIRGMNLLGLTVGSASQQSKQASAKKKSDALLERAIEKVKRKDKADWKNLKQSKRRDMHERRITMPAIDIKKHSGHVVNAILLIAGIKDEFWRSLDVEGSALRNPYLEQVKEQEKVMLAIGIIQKLKLCSGGKGAMAAKIREKLFSLLLVQNTMRYSNHEHHHRLRDQVQDADRWGPKEKNHDKQIDSICQDMALQVGLGVLPFDSEGLARAVPERSQVVNVRSQLKAKVEPLHDAFTKTFETAAGKSKEEIRRESERLHAMTFFRSPDARPFRDSFDNGLRHGEGEGEGADYGADYG